MQTTRDPQSLVSDARQLFSIIEHLTEGVLVFDSQGRLLYMNPALKRIRSFAALQQRNLTTRDFGAIISLYYPDSQEVPQAERPLERLMRKETLQDMRLVLHHRDTGERWTALISGHELEASEPLYLLTLQDITPQEEAERRFLTIFHTNPIAKFIVRLNDLQVIEVNQRFLDMIGYERDDLVGKSLRHVNRFIDSAQRYRIIERVLEDKTPPPEEFTILTRASELVHTLVLQEPVVIYEDLCWLIIFVDVTQQKQTEEHLTQAIEIVLRDARGFSRSIMSTLARIRTGKTVADEQVELTRREQQVLERVAEGWSNTRIATDLGIKEATVRNNLARIYSKIGVSAKAEAAVWAREHGINRVRG
jgi:PAS domain S-box-containing protein